MVSPPPHRFHPHLLWTVLEKQQLLDDDGLVGGSQKPFEGLSAGLAFLRTQLQNLRGPKPSLIDLDRVV